MPADPRPLILVIDDEPDSLELAQALLEAEGFVVAPASNGERALALLEALRPRVPAVIVTDMMMPVLDGLGFLRRYGEQAEPRAPVIAVSGFYSYLTEAERWGVQAVLAKPYPPAALVATVRSLADGSQRRPQPAPPRPEEDCERCRLRDILALGLDHPAPEKALQDFVERVARCFGVKTCLITIVNADRQFWTAGCGLPEDLTDERGSPRQESFCTHAVVARAALVVQDAKENPLFKDNPFVTRRGLRFYAGVPLVARSGSVVGTLCLIDGAPREFSYFDLELLSILARRVVAELDERERRRDPAAPPSDFAHVPYVDRELGLLGREALVDVLAVETWRAVQGGRSVSLVAIEPEGDLARSARALEERFATGWIGRLGRTRLGLIAPGTPPVAAEHAARDAVGQRAAVAAIDASRYVGVAFTALQTVEERLAAIEPEPPAAP